MQTLTQKQIDSLHRLLLDNVEQMMEAFESHSFYDRRYTSHLQSAKGIIDELEEWSSVLHDYIEDGTNYESNLNPFHQRHNKNI